MGGGFLEIAAIADTEERMAAIAARMDEALLESFERDRAIVDELNERAEPEAPTIGPESGG